MNRRRTVDSSVVGEWHRRAVDNPSSSATLAKSIDHALRAQKWRSQDSPTPIRPLILDQGTARVMANVGRKIVDLAAAECERRARDPYELCELLGVERSPLLCGRPSWNRWATSQARPDFVLSNGVPKLLECNITSAFGGPEQLRKMNAVFWRHPEYRDMANSIRTWSGDGISARRELISQIAKQRTSGVPQLAVAGSNEEHYAELIDDAASNGIPCVFVELDELHEDRGLRNAHGLDIDILLLKFFTEGAYADGEPMGALETAVEKDTTLLLGPELSHLYSNKKVLAWLTEHAPRLDPEQREIVDTHVPWTAVLEDRRVLRAGREQHLLSMLESCKDDFVIKPAGGLGGSGVVIGGDVTETEWRKRIEECLSGDHVVQEYCRPDAFPMTFFDEVSGECPSIDTPHVVSPILIGDRAAGFLARFSMPGTTAVTSASSGGTNTVFVHS
ncbi:hypothetical protein ACFQZ2_00290 [Streptomonospora algeriensis]|uniref:Circularly permuted type 2 ATP-grasp protein n=1 Tax=Streptomonospora algeriensis TaxID=995084 RepID=A0ABW3B9P1_9ACTN